jgi:hypothetical protein
MNSRLYNERGNITIESVLYFPIVLTIALTGFHMAALIHASHVGAVAAARGASLVSRSMVSHGNVIWALDEINRVTREMGGTAVHPPQITESSTHYAVSVSLSSPQIVPFLPNSVRRSATSTKEFFIEEQDR